MAKLLVTLLSVLLLVFLRNHQAQAEAEAGFVTLGSKLNPGDHPWLSSSGNFAFGFYEKGSGFAVGIWLTEYPNKTITWTSNRDIPPFPSDASLRFAIDGRFEIKTKQSVMPIAQYPPGSGVASASLLDSGNFVIYDTANRIIWQSFDYPTDTILQGQSVRCGTSLVSSVSDSDRSSGKFTLDFHDDGNLVAYPINTEKRPLDAYWSAGTEGLFQELTLTEQGQLYLNSTHSQVKIAQSPYKTGIRRTIYRATFDSDGNFRLYLHTYGRRDYTFMRTIWSALKNQCQVKSYCGINSYCFNNSTAANSSCFCFPGFVHVDPQKTFLGCYQNFTYGRLCGRSESSNSYNITDISKVIIEDYPYSVIRAVPEDCRKSCFSDCNCWAAQHADGKCNKFTTPILYATLNTSSSTRAFIKLSNKILQAADHDHGRMDINGASGKRKRKIILILTPPLAFVASLFTMLAVFTFLLDRKRARKYQKLLEMENLGQNKEFTLQSFSYSELEKATDGFKHEMGSNSSWKVYEGTISESNRKVAVARLENFEAVREREFEAEMTAMGRIYHKNVVQLVGFCMQGAKKLLVYQFMKNRSLAELLYLIENRPTWKQRKGIAMDVARGIRYLHEECDTIIVHCNIEPKNILVDDNWIAKISNFSSAKLQVPNQEENLAKDREKRRYRAPEWQGSAGVSKKVDVHDYGFLLLEVICCSGNTESIVLSAKEFSSWVYECFVTRELKVLIGDDDADMDAVERMVKAGLICIQGDPDLRPSMKDVVLMLEGYMDIPLPHFPH